MIAEGAEIIDVGGESTRPGACPVPEAEELRRVLPVIEALAGDGRVSIDTRKAGVARAAVAAGASIINDVSATLWPVAAETGAGWVAMHLPADPSVMQEHAQYDDVVAEVRGLTWCSGRRLAKSAGVSRGVDRSRDRLRKAARHNLLLLRHLDVLVATGLPGGDRHQPCKSFLGTLRASTRRDRRPPSRPPGGHGRHHHLGHRPRSGAGPRP